MAWREMSPRHRAGPDANAFHADGDDDDDVVLDTVTPDQMLGPEISGAAAMEDVLNDHPMRLSDALTGPDLPPAEKWAVRGLGGVVVCVAVSVIVIATGTMLTISVLTTKHDFPYFLDKYVNGVDAGVAAAVLRGITKSPHMAGTPGDLALAKRIQRDWNAWGLNAELVPYYPLLSMPGTADIVTVGLPGGVEFRVNGTEPGMENEPTSAPGTGAAPAFNAYSAAGSKVSSYVYVNYGRPEDYQLLVDHGIDLKGKIAIARYGKIFRGLKGMLAEEHDMVACLIYSDPIDDGYGRSGGVYPGGPWRPAGAVQRGSAMYLSLRAGDPLTPGKAAKHGVVGITEAEAENLPRNVMIHPISYRDAEPLLRNMDGPAAPPEWMGGLPIQYRLGPSSVHLNVTITPRTTQAHAIWNVIGRIEGSLYPDEVVVLGNHHDAWTFGAVDPGTGTAVLHEVARGFGKLQDIGWKPERTIVFASWSGEEFALIGSTEWCEEHADMLQAQTIAYINTDVGVSGSRFTAQATPNLDRLIKDIAKTVRAPGQSSASYSVYDDWLHRERTQVPHLNEPRVARLGSGSDYTAFLQHLGISAMDISFRGDYGVYHSNYDSYNYVQRVVDPHFEAHAALARILGSIAMHLVHAPVLPFDFVDYAMDLRRGVDIVASKLPDGPSSHQLSWRGLDAALDAFMIAAVHSRTLQQSYAQHVNAYRDKEIPELNQRLMLTERHFLAPDGVSGRGRNFYRHLIYVPGLYAGYDAVMYPEIDEGIVKQDWTAAQRGIDRVAFRVEQAARHLAGILE